VATQKHMGRNSLVDRLSAQTGSKGMAIAILKKRGHLDASGKLTPEGRSRDRMTASERAKDRAAKDRGGRPNDYRYNPKTNTARKR
jgi:hypothetical protein